ncbi:MAG: 30S ribosomal protein S8 [Candidatus Aureabacteria bacterium]|nr:30S ribosomal protein S8 [Candidatus Auribacterota bacterium]
MSFSDPIADMLTRIRNASKARKESVDMPASKLKAEVARIMKEQGFVKTFKVLDDKKQGVIRVFLKYTSDNKPVIVGLKRISKPGLRKYSSIAKIPKVYQGIGIAVLSTSKGVMTDEEARKANIGGEVLCYIW